MRNGVRVTSYIVLGLVALIALSAQSYSQQKALNWKKRFKQVRFIIYSWEGSIERYQLNLLQNSLTGELVDNMINWRGDAKSAISDLQECPPHFKPALALLRQMAELLGKQEGFCAGREHIMAHLEEWRSNKEKLKGLHKKLDHLLK